MSYQVLARKWRPQNFSEVVGQEHVVRALTNALDHQRLHHAYLFTGTRGVGKTTLARILAKAFNCESREGFNPCGRCSGCSAIDSGHFVDLIEVDAASRTKVEDTRELLENVQYAPSQGQYKVYLIDEVHMLSAHSFNALLKTLEEPPPHVKFLLATTDPQKIPVTVLSRCLQFNLKRLSQEQIAEQMERILADEKLPFEKNAIASLGRAADGSMRDGLSLLDQAIVQGDGAVSERVVSAMLGNVAEVPIVDLLDKLAESDGQGILEIAARLAEFSADFTHLLDELLRALHLIAIEQVVPGSGMGDEAIRKMADRFSAEETQLFYQIALIGQKDLPLAPDPRIGFEMVMLRMLAFQPVGGEERSASTERSTPIRKVAQPAVNDIRETAVQKSQQATVSAPPQRATESDKGDWFTLLQSLNISGMTRELANNCILKSVDEKQCRLFLDSKMASIRSDVTEKQLEKALQERFGDQLKL